MSASPPATRLADANTEHADSPMRKRPRLDTNTDDPPVNALVSQPLPPSHILASASSAEYTGSTSEPLSAGLRSSNTSGITLNLRDPPTAAISSQQESIADTEIASAEMTASQDMQASDEEVDTSQTLREASMSPELVLVGEGEESDETLEDNYEDVEVQDEEMGEDRVIELEEIMTQFPLSEDGDPVEAARRFIKLLADDKLRVEDTEDLREWMTRWNEDSKGVELSQLCLAVASDSEFWRELANLLFKLLSKRNVNGLGAKPVVAMRDVFTSYIELCAGLTEVDLDSVEHWSSDTTETLHLISEKHLLNIGRIMQYWENVPIWKALRASTKVGALDPTSWQQQIIRDVDLEIWAKIITFANSLATRPTLWKHSWLTLSHCTSLLQRLVDQLVRIAGEDRSVKVDCQNGIRAVVPVATSIEQSLLTETSVTTSGVPADHCATIARDAHQMLRGLSMLDMSTAEDFLRVDPSFLAVELDFEEVARLACDSFGLNLLWHLMLNGRMDLRVASVQSMAEILLALWHNYRQADAPVLHAVARWMTTNNVVDKLVGAESHPQILMRSQNIFGFLQVTECWSREITDSYWSRTMAMQDPRLAAAALDAFGVIVNNFQEPALNQVCEKIKQVPVSGFSKDVISFTVRLLRLMQAKSQCSESLAELCLHLICVGSSTTVQPILGLQKIGQDNLVQLSQQALRGVNRQALYTQYSSSIASKSDEAYGSALAAWSVACSQKADDVKFLVEELDILPKLAGLLSSSPPPVSPAKLHAALTLLCLIMKHCPKATLGSDEAELLWRHLVGDMAGTQEQRNIAWRSLSHAVFELTALQSGRQSLLMDNLMDNFLGRLDPQYFTQGLFEFVETAIKYEDRRTIRDLTGDQEIIDPPLSHLVWRFVLEAPENSIDKASMSLLSRLYVDGKWIESGAKAVVEATHVALVQHALKILQDSALTLRRSLEQNSGKSTVLDESHDDQKRHFSRTVVFLRRFLEDVKRRPALNKQSPKQTAPSPTVPRVSHPDEKLVLKWQKVGGPDSQIRELEISEITTIAEVEQVFLTATGSAGLAVYAGAKLDLDAMRNQPATTLIGRGLLLVRDTGSSKRQVPQSPLGTSAAESALAAHLDVLVSFLDLEEPLSGSVYEFLLQFPPHPKIYDLVMQGSSSFTDLFPPKQRQLLYSFDSMRRHLEALLKSDSIDETFLLNGITFLSDVLVSDRFSNMDSYAAEFSMVHLASTLLQFLNGRPTTQAVSSCFTGEPVIEQRLYAALLCGLERPQSVLVEYANVVYSALVEAALHSREIWSAFVSEPRQAELHYWLLNGPAAQKIEDMISNMSATINSSSVVSAKEVADFYWSNVSSLITQSAKHSINAKHILHIAEGLFSTQSASAADEATLRQYLETWSTVLAQHVHTEVPGQAFTDETVAGLVSLITTCVSHLRAFSKSLPAEDLANMLWTKFLFPKVLEASSMPAQPILNGETRKKIYNLVLLLCEHFPTYQLVSSLLSDVVAVEAGDSLLTWSNDRASWLRTTSGYSGLKNLTNTCYMNSLTTQLFMNANFRSFILSLPTPQTTEYNIIRAMQELFARMQTGYLKFTDTNDFAYAIRPWESEHIDVTVQMDVDEFYAILFDRLEDALPDADTKRQLRSFWGGQLITQIKSQDCEHVSERAEPFLTIQCEVKGKNTLQESLSAYVEGDHMEGDNKYKCESCDGRFVNAVKRSCLQNLPDNIIFSLKRFEFDLTTLQRSKINDKFDFPNQINMAPYTLDYLSKPDEDHSFDSFELAGVLVHSGSAETGHYYSYIRLPSDDAGGKQRWAEFNDTEVTDFDLNRIPDSCFGGSYIDSINNMGYPKSWNAYMLLYQRVSTGDKVRRASNSSLHMGPVQAPVPLEVSSKILQENADLLRRYCLYDPVHVQFTKTFASNLKHFNSGICSEDHGLEREVLETALRLSGAVIARTKEPTDFESMMNMIRKLVASCGHCIGSTLLWLTEKEQFTMMVNMLLACRMPLVRQSLATLVLDMLKELRLRDPEIYGLDLGENSPTEALTNACILHRVLETYSQMVPLLGRYITSWDDFLGFLAALAELGRPEVGAMIRYGYLRDALDLIVLDYTRVLCPQVRHQESRGLIQRSKRQPSILMLTKLVYHFLEHLDLVLDSVETEEDRFANLDSGSGKWPLIADELDIIIGNKKHQGFLHNIIERSQHCDWDAQPWWPGKVLSSVVHDSEYNGYDRTIARLLIKALELYYSSWNGFILNSALAFCKASRDFSGVRTVIEAIGKGARTLVTKDQAIRRGSMGFVLDPESIGGTYYLQFFGALAIMKDPACKANSKEEYPLLSLALGGVPCFAGSVLCFDDFATREALCFFLDTLLFNQYPLEIDVNDADANELNRRRCETVRLLFHDCWNKMCIASQKRLPQSWSKHVLQVMWECVKWMEKLHKEDSEDYADLLESGDSIMAENYNKAAATAINWKDDDESWSVNGDGLSDDGYASDDTDVEEILAD